MTAPRLRTSLVLYCAALLASGAAGCSRAAPAAAPAASNRATFRGVYEAGHDRSAFLPCGSSEQWYVLPQSAAARELRRLTSTKDLQPPAGGLLPPERAVGIRRAYAEVRGDTVAVTASRSAVGYERELRVTRVLIVRPAQGGVCPIAAPDETP
jgi:hypothetical protein